MIYLRELQFARRYGSKKELEVFEGDTNKDKEYWEKVGAISVRYFKLEEK